MRALSIPRAVVLFVEPDCGRRAALAASLRERQYWPIATARADEALRVLSCIRPSLVAVAADCPDGLRLLARLRADRHLLAVATLSFASRASLNLGLLQAVESSGLDLAPANEGWTSSPRPGK